MLKNKIKQAIQNGIENKDLLEMLKAQEDYQQAFEKRPCRTAAQYKKRSLYARLLDYRKSRRIKKAAKRIIRKYYAGEKL